MKKELQSGGRQKMQRLFSEHEIRPVRSLDGIWQLTARNGQETPLPAGVPGVWESIPALAAFRGTADYVRKVQVRRDGAVLLRFGGVSHTARIFWDGIRIGEHYNAFTGFEILLPEVSRGEHELRVEVDNSYSDQSALHVPNDYMTYGGINRPVELHEIGGAYLERMAFHAEETVGSFTACVRVFVRALQALTNASLSVSVAGSEAVCRLPDLAPGGSTVADVRLHVTGVRRWDLFQGNLYDLKARLLVGQRETDDLIDRVGFRTVRIAGEDLLLNGRKICIKGFNRHEDHGQFGCSLPPEAMLHDLQLILDLGGNSVRTCHYPNDPRFLDLCDELGILVWEENHARALPEAVFHSELFARQCAACNEEMISQHVNHPSIYLWGLLNECESETPFGRGVYEKQIAQLRALDPTRPVTFATCRLFTDICLDLADIVSFNIYPGWYTQESTADLLDRLFRWMDEHGAKNKPALISEIGAGAIAGFHDPFRRAKWSEERQCEILREQLSAVRQHPRCSGSYIWQFADVKVSEEWAAQRPKTMNNKGIVDQYRQPKMSYLTVREIYSNE